MDRNELIALYRNALGSVLTGLNVQHYLPMIDSRKRVTFVYDKIKRLNRGNTNSKKARDVLTEHYSTITMMAFRKGQIFVGIPVEEGKFDAETVRSIFASEIGHLTYSKATGNFRASEMSELYDCFGQLASTPRILNSSVQVCHEFGKLWIERNEGETIDDIIQRFDTVQRFRDPQYAPEFYGVLYKDAREQTKVIGSPAHVVAFYYLGELRKKYDDKSILRAAGQALFDHSISKDDISKFIVQMESKYLQNPSNSRNRAVTITV